MTKYKVDVYADTICPWCYINKRSIDAAIERHQARYPEDEFDVVWRPYMLYPNAKISGKFSTHSSQPLFLSILDRVERAGSSHGLTFSWEGRTGSTRDSHKLILLAASQDDAAPASNRTHPLISKQGAVTEAILSGALTRNQDVSSREFLIPIALAHGLADTEEEVLRYLDGEEANARVDAEMARARGEIGVTAVPSVVVNGRYRVGGMQEPGVFGGLFERIRAR
ncbi:DSBA-like thioredoxin domain-containing protein [Immersiella caudata]|uniref:DSBA-like thioredoxin domain-containing protein n=1 Tax=Immersiella caudata TaxID=314043 RepID=A0AA40BXM4_9PEZI|nr:DSBA-like thioredoxin domain-containing protein [Immersiella caudata]